MFQTGLLSDSDEPVMLADDVIDVLAASFAALRISGAPAAYEYPGRCITSPTPPFPSVTRLSPGQWTSASEWRCSPPTQPPPRLALRGRPPKPRPQRIAPNPLRAMMQSLRVPIATDVDATNAAETQARLEEDLQRLLDLSETLAAMQHRPDSAQRERDATYGFTSTAAEPSRVADVQARGGAIGRALGAIPPVYETPVKNMHAAQEDAVSLDQLQGEELKDRLQRVNEFLDAANMQQNCLNKPAGSVSRHTDDPEQNTASSPPIEAHSGHTRTRRKPAPATAGCLADETDPEDRHRLDPPPQPGHRARPASADPAPRSAVTSLLGPCAIDTTPTLATASTSLPSP
nr:uncharacterized protein LOC120963429 [Aegilops tauschii subsp. strangulata]